MREVIATAITNRFAFMSATLAPLDLVFMIVGTPAAAPEFLTVCAPVTTDFARTLFSFAEFSFRKFHLVFHKECHILYLALVNTYQLSDLVHLKKHVFFYYLLHSFYKLQHLILFLRVPFD